MNMARLKTKSQITMIMIIGIILLIVACLFLYVSKSSGKKTREGSLKEAQETALEMQPLKEFVSGCLDKLAKDSIVLIGSQGGYIYESQGGTFVDFQETDEGIFFIINNRANAAYNIRQLSIYVPHTYSSTIPDYPWITFPYSAAGSGQKTFTGLFGLNGMPPLKKENGPHSIQEQIEFYVDSNIDGCLDFTPFEAQGYNIEKPTGKTTALFGSNDIAVKMEMPIRAINEQTRESFSLDEFSTNINVRLQDAYYFINGLVENDIQDIAFNLKDVSNNINSFNVKVMENAYANDDIVLVRDEQSLIYGKPFEYVFARKNRAPALYYIRNSVLTLPGGYLITQQDLVQDSELKAEDPDEDATSITIQAQRANPNLPTLLDNPQIKFKVEASDGALSDYQIITVNRI